MSPQPRKPRPKQEPINEPVFVGLEVLYRAYRYAIDTGSDRWDFAVESAILERAGLSRSEFRWLLAHGYAEHAEEITLPTSTARQFKPLGRHQFTRATCFVLREEGVDLVERESDRTVFRACKVPVETADVDRLTERNNGNLTRHRRPVWNSREKELGIDNLVVKRFRWPAPNQELLLDVFEEEGWPRRIDDPLPVVQEQAPRRRLHDTIKCLNRNQENRLIRFRGDGSGEGVTWELLEGSHSQS